MNNNELIAAIQALTSKVEQLDRRTASTASRYYLDDAPAANGKKTAPRELADQIYDLIRESPRTEPDLRELLGGRTRSTVNQAVNKLIGQKRAYVLKVGVAGKGSYNVVFADTTRSPLPWLHEHAGWSAPRR